VSYEAISTSNRTVQRGSRFAVPRLNGPLIDLFSHAFFFVAPQYFAMRPMRCDAMRCDAMRCDVRARRHSCLSTQCCWRVGGVGHWIVHLMV
jgi:hypothetical protein